MTFKQLLASIAKSGKAVRDNVQKAVVIALGHYEQHADTKYLTDLMAVAQSSNAIRTNTLKAFIQAHANVAWSKDKTGENFVFKKVGKEVRVTEVTTRWDLFNKEGTVKPDVSVVSALKGIVTRLENAINDGKLKQGEEELANETITFAKAHLNA